MPRRERSRWTRSQRQNDAAVNDRARFAYRLKTDLIVLSFEEHEMIILVEACRAKWTLEIDAAAPILATRSGDEVVNPLLRYSALIDVVMSGEDGVHSIAHKKRFQLPAQIEV